MVGLDDLIGLSRLNDSDSMTRCTQQCPSSWAQPQAGMQVTDLDKPINTTCNSLTFEEVEAVAEWGVGTGIDTSRQPWPAHVQGLRLAGIATG